MRQAIARGMVAAKTQAPEIHVTVDIRDRDGQTLANAPRREPVASTDVFDALGKGAQARIDAIVAANLPKGAASPKRR